MGPPVRAGLPAGPPLCQRPPQRVLSAQAEQSWSRRRPGPWLGRCPGVVGPGLWCLRRGLGSPPSPASPGRAEGPSRAHCEVRACGRALAPRPRRPERLLQPVAAPSPPAPSPAAPLRPSREGREGCSWGPSSGAAPRKGLIFHLATSATGRQDRSQLRPLLGKEPRGKGEAGRKELGPPALRGLQNIHRGWMMRFHWLPTLSEPFDRNQELETCIRRLWTLSGRRVNELFSYHIFAGCSFLRQWSMLGAEEVLGLESPRWCPSAQSPSLFFTCGVFISSGRHLGGKMCEELKGWGGDVHKGKKRELGDI